MSVNLHVCTEKGKQFELYQTPTVITKEILQYKYPFEGYKKWIEDQIENHGWEPIQANKHLQDLREWMTQHEEFDYEIYWYEM